MLSLVVNNIMLSLVVNNIMLSLVVNNTTTLTLTTFQLDKCDNSGGQRARSWASVRIKGHGAGLVLGSKGMELG